MELVIFYPLVGAGFIIFILWHTLLVFFFCVEKARKSDPEWLRIPYPTRPGNSRSGPDSQHCSLQGFCIFFCRKLGKGKWENIFKMADQLNRPSLQPGVRGRARGRARPEDLPGTLRTSVEGIRDVLVRIRIPGSVPLTNGSGSGFAPLCDLLDLVLPGIMVSSWMRIRHYLYESGFFHQINKLWKTLISTVLWLLWLFILCWLK